MQKKKLLFLCKDRSSGDYKEGKYGLWNSAVFVARALKSYYDCDVESCIDANCINKFVTKHKPNIVILEAIWVTSLKMKELTKIHPKVVWIVRIHSKMPFLANEGMALKWCSEYTKIKNVYLAGNNINFVEDMIKSSYVNTLYLPNIYVENFHTQSKCCNRIRRDNRIINIGCFGSIRPLKNQLIQAVAAINFAKSQKKLLRFHINASRAEQNGDSVLRNLRALFDNKKNTTQLVEHDWMCHYDFINLVSKMDIGMQVSYTESFNIVAADFVRCNIPIVVSDEISFVTSWLHADPNSSTDIENKLVRAYYMPKILSNFSYKKLQWHNKQAVLDWLSVI